MSNPDLSNHATFVPVLTSEAGSCLTCANWNEVGVSAASYLLESLLLKPGLAVLNQLTDLKSYLGWSGDLILNATNLSLNKKGCYTITSTFDGSKISLTPPELVELVVHLKPNAILLPRKIIRDFPDIWAHWDDAIKAFVHVDDLNDYQVQRPLGVYFTVEFLGQIRKWSQVTRYATGDIALDLMKQLADEGVEFIESNQPAQLASQGEVYHHSAELNLTENQAQMQFEMIESDCKCPTCSQHLTIAYLHHLLLHTPLLCQRFLIQHNIFHALHHLRKK